ncbi:cobalamin/Fe3+-siderophore ABC transporter ATP-binding protein [Sphaerisporangium krabiense]|uniref:Iron complex transport system ATP-binding protein n=1 Tax=Sphaerisporangium krabiense TaxID=763782 RepID=A0A7W8Z5U4_9ACTN|nr:ABC transporter ATP-binding protein [Sphaerisporangium krabiense]MBB5627859.1 iron complex transport system ATP-binding protein [Sphaerisporangium krabiense]GII62018.1 cobalamin/Fe3+-siderophore ABC transporter ATP-binding protein [Sphaerisporangium krabiense]
MRLQAARLELGYGDRLVVDGLDLGVESGTVTAIIGPNGCGKSTLLRALGRLLKPAGGHVLLDGARIDRMPSREVAKTLGVLPQAPSAPEGLTVGDLVARGRHPHQAWYRQWSARDEAAVAEALRMTGLLELAERPLDELSGGQRQRAWISMALAQGTPLLLLDEPTTFLDLAHQIEVLDLVARLRDELGRTVVMVLHDLNLAARYADRLVAMRDGRLVATGSPHEVLTEPLLSEVFDLRAKVVPDPVFATPMIVPIGLRRPAAEAGA